MRTGFRGSLRDPLPPCAAFWEGSRFLAKARKGCPGGHNEIDSLNQAASVNNLSNDRSEVTPSETPELSSAALDLSAFTTIDLLRIYSRLLGELRQRGVTRSYNNPVADLAEGIVALALGTELAGKSNAGHDLIGADGTRIEVKARRLTKANPSRQMGVIRNLDQRLFDKLVCVLFGENFDIVRACIVPHSAIKELARFGKSINGYLLHAEDELWQRSDVVDLTEELRATMSSIDEYQDISVKRNSISSTW